MDKKKLIALRGQCKATFTKLEKYFQEPKESLQLEEIIVRQRTLNDSFEKYKDIQAQLMILDGDVADDEDDIEERYIQLCVGMEKLRSKSQREQFVPERSSNSAKLPPLDIPVFDGRNIGDFKPFMDMYIKAEPLQLIDNLPLINESYSAALDLLKKRYDNPSLLINNHISMLLDMPMIHRGEVSLLLAADVFFRILKDGKIEGGPADPILLNTRFGYIISVLNVVNPDKNTKYDYKHNPSTQHQHQGSFRDFVRRRFRLMCMLSQNTDDNEYNDEKNVRDDLSIEDYYLKQNLKGLKEQHNLQGACLCKDKTLHEYLYKGWRFKREMNRLVPVASDEDEKILNDSVPKLLWCDQNSVVLFLPQQTSVLLANRNEITMELHTAIMDACDDYVSVYLT
ncbi:hypothetical protein EVAR_56699_1 [Eumeta japonica]|uniref:Uncharacterized protein n=1 Tax=Eumeta variegata TaxID=151549 RepID=A0A4C1Y1K9_EUMVA|nr:hypothetical protein EVAR_56699_1 [Eumeta japonica]